MSVELESAVNHNTAAILALAVTIERERIGRIEDGNEVEIARGNVTERHDMCLEYLLRGSEDA